MPIIEFDFSASAIPAHNQPIGDTLFHCPKTHGAFTDAEITVVVSELLPFHTVTTAIAR